MVVKHTTDGQDALFIDFDRMSVKQQKVIYLKLEYEPSLWYANTPQEKDQLLCEHTEGWTVLELDCFQLALSLLGVPTNTSPSETLRFCDLKRKVDSIGHGNTRTFVSALLNGE